MLVPDTLRPFSNVPNISSAVYTVNQEYKHKLKVYVTAGIMAENASYFAFFKLLENSH